MLKVDQYSYIRTAHRVYGKKIKQIARETGHSKNTIKKVLRGEYSGYKPRLKQPFPILGAYLKIIDQWLEDDKTHPKKQRHTAVRVYIRLRQEHNFKGSETTAMIPHISSFKKPCDIHILPVVQKSLVQVDHLLQLIKF